MISIESPCLGHVQDIYKNFNSPFNFQWALKFLKHTNQKHIPILSLFGNLKMFILDTFQSSPVGWLHFGTFIWFYRTLPLDAFQQ
jgi:hypothetical protein